ncbi:hypothetical protein CAPTEDRAFT_205222, partial [Capitella teleta]
MYLKPVCTHSIIAAAKKKQKASVPKEPSLLAAISAQKEAPTLPPRQSQRAAQKKVTAWLDKCKETSSDVALSDLSFCGLLKKKAERKTNVKMKTASKEQEKRFAGSEKKAQVSEKRAEENMEQVTYDTAEELMEQVMYDRAEEKMEQVTYERAEKQMEQVTYGRAEKKMEQVTYERAEELMEQVMYDRAEEKMEQVTYERAEKQMS